MQEDSQVFETFGLSQSFSLPIITGTNVKAAYSRTQTPVRTPLVNFPRFLRSRTLKRRHSLHRRSEEVAKRGVALVPARQVDSTSLAHRLFNRKSTPADLIHIEKLQQKDEATATESRDHSVAKWLAQRKASQAISLKQKSKKLKIVVSLPKPRRNDGVAELKGSPALALLRITETAKLKTWASPFHLQAWAPEQSAPGRHFFKLAMG